jgi:hypothetical protein
MPIRVARFAIDDHTPHCDLYLSQHHDIFVDEALIPLRRHRIGHAFRYVRD